MKIIVFRKRAYKTKQNENNAFQQKLPFLCNSCPFIAV